MSRRKISVILAASILLLLLFSGCQDDVKTDKYVFTDPVYKWGEVKDKTITIWGDINNLDRNYMTKTFNRYKELTGNTIVTRLLSKAETDRELPLAFASDTIERPDILLSQGGTNLINLKPESNFYNFINAEWIEDVSDTGINQSIYNGQVIGLPYGEASVSGTIYNKEIFAKYKLSVPKTQEEFMAVCEALLSNGVTPMYLPYAEVTMLLYQFPMDSILQDDEILSGLNAGTLSYAEIPEMRKIVEWYKTMSDKGYFGENYHSNNWNGMDSALNSGKYAMMLCWDTWLYTDFTGNKNNFGIMPAFIGVPENGCFEGPNLTLFIVNKKSKNMDAALDLISFMADPYNYNVALDGIYTAPVFNNQSWSLSTPQYTESESLIERLFYNSTAWSEIRGFSQIDAKYIQNYMQGMCTIDECLISMDNARIERASETFDTK